MSWKDSEIIDLASEGFFYPNNHPFSSGSITIYPITGRCEEMLCNGTLIKRGLMLQKLLDEVLTTKVSVDDILQCDIDTILLNLKIICYGRDSRYKIKCENCNSSDEHVISYGFKSKSVDFHNYIRGVNELSYTFPKCGKTIKYRLPNNKENKILILNGWLSFIKNQTISIDGVDDINYFYDYELPITDNKIFKNHYENNTPGFHTTIEVTCPSCKTTTKSKIDIDTDIFGFSPISKKLIHDEIFDLCYHSEGSFTRDSVYDMPTHTRNFYIKRLIDIKHRESEQAKSASKGKSNDSQVPNRPKVKK